MSKNVLIVSTSLRKGGNSETLADYFLKGVKEAGHNVEKISLVDKNINFCKGCLTCLKTGKCIINDDANIITEKMMYADVIVFATPIYYYEMSGQMKTILDRANSLYGSDYHFREIYMLTAAAEDDKNTSKIAENGLKGWIECFPKAELKGTVFAGGVDSVGTITGHPALSKAYEMGKNI